MSSDETETSGPIVTLHMVTSLDGYIARHDSSIAWLDSPANAYDDGVALDDAEVESVLESIDCYVLGSRTYEHALELGGPYGDTPTVIVTSRDLQPSRETVELYSGDLERLVTEVLAPRFESVWLVGGAMLCQEFLGLDLVDRLVLSIGPTHDG